MIKAILFDWDDVFIKGSKEGYFDCYHKTLLKLKILLKKKEEERRILENWSKPPKYEFKGLLKEHPEKIDAACKIYEEILLNSDSFMKHVKPINGIHAMITRLSNKYMLGVATGMNPVLLRKIITLFVIPDKFSKIISGYDINDEKKQKPSPYMLNELLKYFNVAAEEAIYVGDAKTDVLMAKNAGVMPIVVLTGHLSKAEAQKMGVKHIIKNVSKIDDVLLDF